MTLEPTLGDRLTIAVDPNWENIRLWQHPFGSVLSLTFVDFEAGITESMSPNYVNTEVTGRAEAYRVWINNPNKFVSFMIRFRAQGLDGQVGEQAILDEVVLPARFLEALKNPVFDVSRGITYAPPPVLVKIGRLLTIRGVLSSGDPQWTAPVDPDTLLPYGCDFQVSFAVTRTFKDDLSYFAGGATGGPLGGVWT